MHFSFDRMTELFQGLLRLRVENFIVFAIVAYFSGWLYVNYFFSEFGINRSSFTFDHYTVFVYFFYVLIKVPGMLLGWTLNWELNPFLGLVTLLGALVVSAIRLTRERIPALDLAQRVLVVLLGFGCIFFFSIEAGIRDARGVIDERKAREVSIVLTKDIEDAYARQFNPAHAKFVLCDLAAAGDNGALALVWRTSEETLILRYDDTVGADHSTPIATYRIPNEYIALIESTEVSGIERRGGNQSPNCTGKEQKAHEDENTEEETGDEDERVASDAGEG